MSPQEISQLTLDQIELYWDAYNCAASNNLHFQVKLHGGKMSGEYRRRHSVKTKFAEFTKEELELIKSW